MPLLRAFSGKVGTGFPVRKCDHVKIWIAFSSTTESDPRMSKKAYPRWGVGTGFSGQDMRKVKSESVPIPIQSDTLLFLHVFVHAFEGDFRSENVALTVNRDAL